MTTYLPIPTFSCYIKKIQIALIKRIRERVIFLFCFVFKSDLLNEHKWDATWFL